MGFSSQQLNFIKEQLLIDMPSEIAFSICHNDSSPFCRALNTAEIIIDGYFDNDVIFSRVERLDLTSQITQSGTFLSTASRYNFPGLSIIYMRNLAYLLRDHYGFDSLNLRAGSATGAAIWPSCGFVLDYPPHRSSSTRKRDLDDLGYLRHKIAMEATNAGLSSYECREILVVLKKAQETGFIDKGNESILWAITDKGREASRMLMGRNFNIKLDLHNPEHIQRLEARAAQKIRQRQLLQPRLPSRRLA